MTHKEVMKELEAMGTAQNRKVYSRHGVGGKMFGVSFENLTKLKKKIKTDHDLAEKLWASENHDARLLATMIADPAKMTSAKLDAWVKEIDNYILADSFSRLAEDSAFAREKMKKWTASRSEWTGRAGWQLLARLAMSDASLTDEVLEEYLKTIESRIHTSKNRQRDAMNNAVIAIGIRSAALEKKTIAVAKRIGKIEVDHGETGCKTPDAVEYIERVKDRRRKIDG
jgi:3-methyladenine DNA glycosylase AlkD